MLVSKFFRSFYSVAFLNDFNYPVTLMSVFPSLLPGVFGRRFPSTARVAPALTPPFALVSAGYFFHLPGGGGGVFGGGCHLLYPSVGGFSSIHYPEGQRIPSRLDPVPADNLL